MSPPFSPPATTVGRATPVSADPQAIRLLREAPLARELGSDGATPAATDGLSLVCVSAGPYVDRASAEQERRLEERRIDRALTWDLRTCPTAMLEDLALDLFSLNYLPRAVSAEVLRENGRSIEEQLGSLRFFNRRLRAPTNAAVLLFGKDPLYHVPGAYVQYVR